MRGVPVKKLSAYEAGLGTEIGTIEDGSLAEHLFQISVFASAPTAALVAVRTAKTHSTLAAVSSGGAVGLLMMIVPAYFYVKDAWK